MAIIVSALVMVVMTGSALAAHQALVSDPLVAPLPSTFVTPALLIRNEESSFGSFSGESPQALTVDQATGDVYVLDPPAGKLWRFAANGTPDNFTAGPGAGTNSIGGFSFQGFPGLDQVAVDDSSGPAKGDVYVTESGQHRVKAFSSTGEPIGTLTGTGTPNGGLGEDCGIAVDQSNGDVYIANRGFDIWRYSPSKSVVSETDYSGGIEVGIEPCQLAVANGSLYAKQWQEFPILGAGPLDKFSTSAFTTEEIGFGAAKLVAQNVTGVATDPSTDDVYADQGNKIAVFDQAGNPLYTFGSSTDFGSESASVVVNGASGNAYVADPLHQRVDVYGPAFVAPPIATTESASEIRHVKATLNGHLDLNEGPEIIGCQFEWGTTNTYGNMAPCTGGNNYAGAADVSATITGLEPGKIYHYRLAATSTAGTGHGEDQRFETTQVSVVHVFKATFGTSGSGDGQLSGNTGLAVNETSGDVYVADTANHRVEQFDQNGVFISAFGWGVKDGKPEAQTCVSSCQTGISGSGQGQLATPMFVAIDNSSGPSNGDVYVGDTTNNTVTKYDANGNYISTNDGSASGSAFGPLAGITIDQNGNLWVYDTSGEMREFTQNGTFATEWNSNIGVTPAGIAIDSTETLYLVRGNPGVGRFSATGVQELDFVTGTAERPTFNGPTTGLAIDPAGGDLYVDDGGKLIRDYPNPATCVPHGEGQSPGCATSDVFGGNDLNAGGGVAVNAATGRVYVSDPDTVKIFDAAVRPEVTTGTSTAPSPTSAELTGTIDPNGVALTDCHFEYVSDAAFLATGFEDLSSGGSIACSPNAGSIPTDLEEHTVKATITGLDPTIIYHFRLVAANSQNSITGQATGISGVPLVETTGSPTRTATTARLDSRLDPRGAPTTYHFEYGDQGPCDTDPCISTPPQQAGNGETYELVSQQLTGLKANTTYHYRLVADNGIPGGAAYGQDTTITTQTTDAPLTHGHLPGPPDSDRAWEQVSIPNTDGNEVDRAVGISDSGERAVYSIMGGNPGSQYGGGLVEGNNFQYAERTTQGWRNRSLVPARSQAPGNEWFPLTMLSDLSQVFALNRDSTNTGSAETWRLSPGVPAQHVLSSSLNQEPGYYSTVVSADGSRIFSVLEGNIDPEHSAEPGADELYDITTGVPHMVSFLPDGSVPSCGVRDFPPPSPEENWVTPDGSHVFFETKGNNCGSAPIGLYMRDITESKTVQIAAQGSFLKSSGGALYFTTRESLVPNDPGGSDAYRYGIENGSMACLTCSTAAAGSVGSGTMISDDGSRIYFESDHRLLQGAAPDGIYRLNVATRDLAYVASITGSNTKVGRDEFEDNTLTPDGSIFVFQSESPALNALNGPQNGNSLQDYLYDDEDRSLVCVSCPGDGSQPRGGVLEGFSRGGRVGGWPGSPLSSGGDFVFATPTPLVAADQNTARPDQDPAVGVDVYEWRDGSQLLVTDGQTYNLSYPRVVGSSRSGRDVFFTQAAALTPDAIDDQRHLYDARIGGGFEFPPPPPPCSLEACQGIASPPPNDGTPASLSFSGPGNQTNSQGSSSKLCGSSGACVKSHARKKTCPKGKALKRGKCVKKIQHKRKLRVKRTSRNHGGAK
ncbi:MAG TPA: hypothetical protein VFR48_09410 [Solirubrobacteraceae bacterium]|nr:hypothetical protein [Solirubrobacteraceae bacterium]